MDSTQMIRNIDILIGRGAEATLTIRYTRLGTASIQDGGIERQDLGEHGAGKFRFTPWITPDADKPPDVPVIYTDINFHDLPNLTFDPTDYGALLSWGDGSIAIELCVTNLP